MLKQAGWKYKGGNRVMFQGALHKFSLSQPIQGAIKTVTIKRDNLGHLWICFSVIEMDTIDFSDVYAFTAIDTYSRVGQVVLYSSLTSRDDTESLKRVVDYFGGCQVTQTDGGSKYEGEFLAALPQYAGQYRIARPYRKNERAFIERFNRTVCQLPRMPGMA